MPRFTVQPPSPDHEQVRGSTLLGHDSLDGEVVSVKITGAKCYERLSITYQSPGRAAGYCSRVLGSPMLDSHVGTVRLLRPNER